MGKPFCCSFCNTHASKAEFLLEGPDGALICTDCLEAGMAQVARQRRKAGWGLPVEAQPNQ